MHIYIIQDMLLSKDLKYQYQYFAQPAAFKEADQLAIYKAQPSIWTRAGTTEKKIPLVAGRRPWSGDLQLNIINSHAV